MSNNLNSQFRNGTLFSIIIIIVLILVVPNLLIPSNLANLPPDQVKIGDNIITLTSKAERIWGVDLGSEDCIGEVCTTTYGLLRITITLTSDGIFPNDLTNTKFSARYNPPTGRLWSPNVELMSTDTNSQSYRATGGPKWGNDYPIQTIMEMTDSSGTVFILENNNVFIDFWG